MSCWRLLTSAKLSRSPWRSLPCHTIGFELGGKLAILTAPKTTSTEDDISVNKIRTSRESEAAASDIGVEHATSAALGLVLRHNAVFVIFSGNIYNTLCLTEFLPCTLTRPGPVTHCGRWWQAWGSSLLSRNLPYTCQWIGFDLIILDAGPEMKLFAILYDWCTGI